MIITIMTVIMHDVVVEEIVIRVFGCRSRSPMMPISAPLRTVTMTIARARFRRRNRRVLQALRAATGTVEIV